MWKDVALRAPGRARGLLALALALTLVGASGVTAAEASGGARPRLRLFSATDTVKLTRARSYPIPLDVGVYLASLRAPLELRASRSGYAAPISISQWLNGGRSVRPLPTATADGWNGLGGFLRVQIRNDSGHVTSNSRITFCPGYNLQRVDDSGPDQSPYPPYCGLNPFTLGAVWGIPRGWAASVIDPYPFSGVPAPMIDGPDGHYTVRISITAAYRRLFQVTKRDASTEVGVKLVTVRNGHGSLRGRDRAAAPSPQTPSPQTPSVPTQSVPTLSRPKASILPDLIPLPAWHLYASHRPTGDYLNFAANIWNAGSSPLVVEGFRRPGTKVMDAYQYFYRDGKVVGRAPAGTLNYDARPGHEHWHFEQFARYSLVDASKKSVVVSDKEAFCLAPTDPIDLTLPGANWHPFEVGLSSACGGRSAIWTRETLDPGWGDTYMQDLPGQSFDISHVPNGKYFVKVVANPIGRLHERDTGNNTTYRPVVLRGTPGHRTVRVPDWHGIDSESQGFGLVP